MEHEATAVRVAMRYVARALRDPVIVAFVLAGIFEILSGDPVVHAMVLFAIPLALMWDAIRSREVSSRGAVVAQGRRGSTRSFETSPGFASAARGALGLSPMLVAVVLTYAVIVGSFARWSWPVSVTVALTGACAVAVAWGTPYPRPEPPTVSRGGARTWAAVFVSLGLWELTTLLLQPSLTTSSWAHPTLSTLMDPVLAHHIGRSIVLVVWLAVGRLLLLR